MSLGISDRLPPVTYAMERDSLVCYALPNKMMAILLNASAFAFSLSIVLSA